MTSTLPDILPSVGLAASPRFHPAIWPVTAHSDDDGRLRRAAVRCGVGRIVLDSTIEITALAGMAEGRQRVLIRVTPDLDIHGHRAVTTGISDQKFGFTLDGGHAADAVARVPSP